LIPRPYLTSRTRSLYSYRCEKWDTERRKLLLFYFGRFLPSPSVRPSRNIANLLSAHPRNTFPIDFAFTLPRGCLISLALMRRYRYSGVFRSPVSCDLVTQRRGDIDIDLARIAAQYIVINVHLFLDTLANGSPLKAFLSGRGTHPYFAGMENLCLSRVSALLGVSRRFSAFLGVSRRFPAFLRDKTNHVKCHNGTP